MNPQYMQQQQPQQQQQPPYFSAPQNSPYGELNSNVPPAKGSLLNSQTYVSQKPMQGPPSLHPQPQYYTNNLPQANAQHASPTSSPHSVPPSSQGNLVNQMSNMTLGNQQRPPSAQNYLPPPPPPPPAKSSPVVSNAANVNGFNSPIDAMPSGTGHLGQADPGGKSTLISGQDTRAGQQNVSQAASLPFSGPITTGASHFPGQTIPTSEHGFSAGLSSPGQQSEQTNATDARSHIGQQMPPLSQPQTLSNSPLPPSSQGNNLSGPPSHGPPRQNLPEAAQNTSRPPLVGLNSGPPLPGQNLSAPPLSGPTLSGPPLPGQNLSEQRQSSRPPLVGLNSGPPLPGQNLSAPPLPGPLLPGQNLPGPPLPGQNLSEQRQNMPRPPLVGQNFAGTTMPGQNPAGPPLPGQNLSAPPLSGHQYLGQQKPNYYPDSSNMPPLSGPPLAGQQNLGQNYNRSPLPGSQPHMLPGQAQTSNMPPGAQPGQRQYSSAPPMPGQMASPMGMNRAPVGPGYQQGYQGYHNQGDMYSSQRSPYEGDAPEYQQTRRIDAKLMPSPIQAIEDDQYVRGGVFVTNERGLVPPLVTTKFVTQDEGNASPRYIRSTMYTVPTTADITKQSNVPFSLILSPMARIVEGEYEPPIVDMGEIGPVRCVRCKAYMSPFMQFIDAGRRFQCMLCKATTEVPAEYFQHLDHTGQRMDRYERPELMLGTYEYLATKDYCRNNTFPKPPAVVFVIDVSYNTVKSGLVNLLCMRMKSIIRNLPIDAGQTKTNMRVGFITYNNTVHFYNINPCLAQPQMMIVGDVQDVFMPLLDGFLCDPEESEAVIDSLMAQIPTMFAETRETETILAPAIQAGLEALKASECAGKLMVFHSSLPIAEAPGKLKNRNDRNLLGTEKEKTVLAPQNNVYNNLGQDCVGVGCSVDLFIFNNSYVDIATIGQICRLTGGEIYKYTYFQADIDGERLITDLINNISRPIAFDAVMRVRTSTGVRATDFYGHFFMSNTTDMELASIDCNKAVAIEIKHDDKLTDDEGVYVQAALLYTSCAGIRRLRIINLSLKTSSQFADLYRACDLDAIMNYFLKQSVFKLIDSTPNTVKNSLISKCVNILATYRRYCASPSSSAQLILPECMKLLPLYVNAVLKSDAISGGADMTIDDRSYIMQVVATMPVSISVVYIYPRLMALHEVDPQDTEIPRILRCSISGFTDDGAYLLENSVHMFLWLGSALSPQWVQGVFGVSSVVEVDTDRTALPVLDSPLNKRIRDIINRVRAERHRCMRLTIVRQREKLEMVLRHFLIEDKRNDGSECYVDFICHVHKEIRTLLNLV